VFQDAEIDDPSRTAPTGRGCALAPACSLLKRSLARSRGTCRCPQTRKGKQTRRGIGGYPKQGFAP
jgi:hypothetical protein